MKTIRPISDPELRIKEVACDDLIIVMRPQKNELGCVTSYDTQTITANEFCASIMAQTLETLGQILPRTDPADGKTLWVKDGCLAFASGDPTQLGTIAPYAMKKSLQQAFQILPTSDPGDGSPWLSGNILMQGSQIKTNKGI
ncbi:hypothetical protein [Commensalibacter papalotli (ex Botero et al. 2024)]|uniref:hypothetical protein n=1 Tax=Commensalibacter papalotli (ex Botero et al. 2024) TaxID=2972766 RepID=UPI0022FF7F0F|nr:hypothetical protein [Commensalibacter papalotli (ex Botero et al. 2024)]CAI3945776.1 unnamed protein product [Commensalibacter papalotli (ex Botero et al. 2024)]